MTMAWIRIEQSLTQNRKLYSLKSALRIDTAKAIGTLALLWMWAIDNADSGSLGCITAEQLAEVCQFPRNRAPQLRQALLDSGFLELRGADLVIHDWDDFGGRIEKRRDYNRDYKRRRRCVNIDSMLTESDVKYIDQNIQDQTIPDQTRQDETISDKTKNNSGDAGDPRTSRESDREVGDYLLGRDLIPESWFGQEPGLADKVRHFADSLFERVWGRTAGPTDYGRVFNCVVDRGEDESGQARCRFVDDRRDLLLYAFEAAAAAGHTGEWDYVYGVLRRLRGRGIHDLGEAEEFEWKRAGLTE